MLTLLVLGVAVVFGVLVCVALAWRRMRATPFGPARPIAKAEEGALVVVKGRVRLVGDALIAPLSARRCAVSQVAIHSVATHFRPVHTDVMARDFVIEDATGRALVRLGGARARVNLRRPRRFDPPLPYDSDLVNRFLFRLRDLTGKWLHGQHLRYLEAALVEGATVVVAGLARWEVDPDPIAWTGYRETPRRLVLSAPPDGALWLSD